MTNGSMQCCITVRGRVAAHWSRWLGELQHSYRSSENGEVVTELCGKLADQSALQGVLKRIWDLNLTVLAVTTWPQDAAPAGSDG